jgi:predicted anti-sigma-YlaC factor YlaD
MDCQRGRELISADLDGEARRDERVLLAGHLDTCASCRGYAAAAADAHRSWRVQSAPHVPELTGRILAAATAPAPGGSGRRPRWAALARHKEVVLRVALAVVAVGQLLSAGPDLVQHADFNDDLHAVHHLNAWAVAFAFGLAVAAWQPWRVRGLLPLAAALGGVMAFTVGLDMFNHHAVGMPATAHLVEVAGLALMWALARTQPGSDPGSTGGRWARFVPARPWADGGSSSVGRSRRPAFPMSAQAREEDAA